MYIDIVPNRNSRPAVLLREAWREGKKIKKRTIANLSDWPAEQIAALRQVLRGDFSGGSGRPSSIVEAEIVIERSLPHGAVAAALGTISQLGLDRLISSKPCRERDLVAAMIAERLLNPCSKLSTTRMWLSCTLGEELGVSGADEDDLYSAMDWLWARQERIERKLAARHLAEGIVSPDYPGERLVVCKNPLLQEERRRKREELLSATERELCKIAAQVPRRKTPLKQEEIGLRVGKVINRWKMAKHFVLSIAEGRFEFHRDEAAIAQEASLDGFYVIRTSEPAARFSAEDVVRTYKQLAKVERLFRTLKGIDLKARPIYHRDANRVRAHIFICQLAYYVEWHMRRALAPLLFDDESPDPSRDPVAPAQISVAAQNKKRRRQTADGLPIHSFESLLQDLATLTRNTCRIAGSPAFQKLAAPTPLQAKAFELLGLCCP